MEYFGKSAYQGDIVKNYESDRVIETIWAKEQNWVAAYLQNIPENSSLLDLPLGTGRFLPFCFLNSRRHFASPNYIYANRDGNVELYQSYC